MQYQYRHPWTGELLGNASINTASSAFRELLVSQLKAVWDAYDFAGFFMDTSYYTINDGNGLIDGLNSVQGGVALYKELGEAMPGAIFMGERFMRERLRLRVSRNAHCSRKNRTTSD